MSLSTASARNAGPSSPAGPARPALVLVAAAAGTLFVMMVMIVMMMFAAAATAGLFMVMIAATAATARFLTVMVMIAATAAARIFAVVVPAAAATAFLFTVMVVAAATAAAATAAAAGMTFDADGLKGLLDFRDFETDHAEHLGDVRQRQHRKAFRSLGHFNASVDEGSDGLLHRAQVARDVKHLFNGRTHDPELARIVDENVVDEKRTLFFNGNGDHALGGFKGILPGHALGGRENELLGAVKNGLGGSRFGRQELGKGRHFEFL